MTGADYADDLVVLTNTPGQAESLLHSVEQAAEGICFYINANKTKYMYYKWEWAISTLSGRPLKLVDKFIYLGNNISSIESEVDIYQVKPLTAIDWLYGSLIYPIK